LLLSRKIYIYYTNKKFNTYAVEQEEEENILAVLVVDNNCMKEEINSLMMMYRKYDVNETDM